MLFLASAFGAVMLLPFSLLLGEQVIPARLDRVFLLALGSQVIGQGLLVYAIGSCRRWSSASPCSPSRRSRRFVGWVAYGETLSPLDWVGAAAIALALVLVRLPERGLRTPAGQPS